MKTGILWALALTFSLSAITQIQMQELYRNKQRFQQLVQEQKGNWQQEASKVLDAIKKYDKKYAQENQELLTKENAPRAQESSTILRNNSSEDKSITMSRPVNNDNDIHIKFSGLKDQINQLFAKLRNGTLKNDSTIHNDIQNKIDEINKLWPQISYTDFKDEHHKEAQHLQKQLNDWMQQAPRIIKAPTAPAVNEAEQNKVSQENYNKAVTLYQDIGERIALLAKTTQNYNFYKSIDTDISTLSSMLNAVTVPEQKSEMQQLIHNIRESFKNALVDNAHKKAKEITDALSVFENNNNYLEVINAKLLNDFKQALRTMIQDGLLWKYIDKEAKSIEPTLQSSFPTLARRVSTFLQQCQNPAMETMLQKNQALRESYFSLGRTVYATFFNAPKSYQEPNEAYYPMKKALTTIIPAHPNTAL